jgi:hypothetical protein
MRQLVPEGHVVAEVHCRRHAPSTQSLPALHCAAWVHVPAGRSWHRPDWQLWFAPQSLSTVQPTTHLLLMHHEPWPQSELYVQLEGTPPPAPPPVPALPPPEALLPPVPALLPPVPELLPPVPALPPPAPL